MRYRDIQRAHAHDYVQRVATGTLLQEEVRQINLPMNAQLIKRSFLALNGTYTTALKALDTGVACHAAGGTHHAHYSHGSGFCVLNDLAFTAVNLIEHGLVEKCSNPRLGRTPRRWDDRHMPWQEWYLYLFVALRAKLSIPKASRYS